MNDFKQQFKIVKDDYISKHGTLDRKTYLSLYAKTRTACDPEFKERKENAFQKYKEKNKEDFAEIVKKSQQKYKENNREKYNEYHKDYQRKKNNYIEVDDGKISP